MTVLVTVLSLGIQVTSVLKKQPYGEVGDQTKENLQDTMENGSINRSRQHANCLCCVGRYSGHVQKPVRLLTGHFWRAGLLSSVVRVILAFQSFDYDHNGFVSRQEFKRVVESFCLQVSDDQLDELISKIDLNKDGQLSYLEFLRHFGISESGQGHAWLKSNHRFNKTRSPRPLPVEQVEKELREKISDQWGTMARAFRMFDMNGDGVISKAELRKVLESFCFQMSDSQFDQLWSKYDENRDGQLQYMEFVKRLGVEVQHTDKGHSMAIQEQSEAEGKRHRLQQQQKFQQLKQHHLHAMTSLPAEHLEQLFRHKMKDNYDNMRKAFNAIDGNNDGIVTWDELRAIVDSFAMPLSENAFIELMKRFGVQPRDSLPYDVFLQKIEGTDPGQVLPIKPSHRYHPVIESTQHMAADDIMALLQSRVSGSHDSIHKAFLKFDDDKDGFISHSELRKVIETFTFNLTENQFREVLSRLDPRNKGLISFREFIGHFGNAEDPFGHKWLVSTHRFNKALSPRSMSFSEVEHLIRMKIMDQWKTMAAAFRELDTNSDGCISQSELKSLLHRFGMAITDEQFQQFWARCDENSDGTLDFHEFFRQLGIDISGGDVGGHSTKIADQSEASDVKRKAEHDARLHRVKERAQDATGRLRADQVLHKLKDVMTQRSSDMNKTFRHYDTDNNGLLSQMEFRKALEGLGFFMTDTQFNLLLDSIGFYGPNLRYSEFLETFTHTPQGSQRQRSRQVAAAVNIPPLSASNVPDVSRRLRERVVHDYKTLRQAFLAFDHDKNGVVSMWELKRILDNFCFVLDKSELQELMNTLDLNKDGKIDYREFLIAFGADKGAIHEMEAMSQQIDAAVKQTPTMKQSVAAEESKRVSAERGGSEESVQVHSLSGGKSPRSQARGNVSPKQTSSAASKGNMSKDKFNKVKHLKSSGISSKTGTAFVDIGVTPPCSAPSKKERAILQSSVCPLVPGPGSPVLDALLSKYKDSMHKNWKNVRREFRAMDPSATDMVSSTGFRNVLQHHGLKFSEDEFFYLVSYFDDNLTKKINYNEFIRIMLSS
ncbi:EF-hand calcium-binding domain-containing protein 6-like [Corticium candelabrum]|uniref:EF-hand calcium-binding domain-containing protein 6-like n=1 Tax=Corticium candelabrum TaxID=121492 RepID=UPI002E260AE2|nr:EF-hand calcium-binding domain-containing protein 6-like [Corticium candelabrum]